MSTAAVKVLHLKTEELRARASLLIADPSDHVDTQPHRREVAEALSAVLIEQARRTETSGSKGDCATTPHLFIGKYIEGALTAIARGKTSFLATRNDQAHVTEMAGAVWGAEFGKTAREYVATHGWNVCLADHMTRVYFMTEAEKIPQR